MCSWRGHSGARVYERPYFTTLVTAKDFTVYSETKLDFVQLLKIPMKILSTSSDDLESVGCKRQVHKTTEVRLRTLTVQ